MILCTAGQTSDIPVRQFGTYCWGCRRWPVVSVTSRPKLCTLFCAGKCFGLELWQQLYTGNSFPCGLGVHNSVSLFWKGVIFSWRNVIREGVNFTPKSVTLFMDEPYPKRQDLLCNPRSQLFNRNRGFCRKEYKGRNMKLIFKLHLTSMLAVILRLLRAFMSCPRTVPLYAPQVKLYSH
jgi:hypothetical protein